MMTGSSYAFSTDWQKEFIGMTPDELRGYFRAKNSKRCNKEWLPFDIEEYDDKSLYDLLVDLRELWYKSENTNAVVEIEQDYEGYRVGFVNKTWETDAEYELRMEIWVRERLEWNINYAKEQEEKQFDSMLRNLSDKVNAYFDNKNRKVYP